MVGEAAVTDLADSAGHGDLFLVGEITVALVFGRSKSRNSYATTQRIN